jgi:hypothetical protein
MSGLGGYIWFIGLGACLVVLAAAYFVADLRKPKHPAGAGGDPNHAWKQAAAETGHPEVARPAPSGRE